ncbi:MAG: autotransporter-associated beta strand repeat-containing protein [Verrucomicrobiota bacterium]
MKKAIQIAIVTLAYTFHASAATKVLVIGGSEPYQLTSEAAFPVSGVRTHLQEILAGDTLVSKPVTVQSQDTYQSHASTGYSSRTLMSWFYWPSSQPANLTLLANNWNYVVMVDDPFVASTFPEYHLEGVMRISQEARKAGAEPISVMTWSSGSKPLSAFAEMAYRVGDGTNVPVAPAGYAWNNVPANLKDSGTRPTVRGAYVTAATVYSRMFNRSAKSSTYIPAGLSQANRDTLADAAFNAVVNETNKTQYTGTLRRPTHFASPLLKDRAVRFAKWNSSTETRICGELSDSLNAMRMKFSQPYTKAEYHEYPVMPEAVDFCVTRWYSAANPSNWANVAAFDFHENNGQENMVYGIERVMYNNSAQTTGASDVSEYYMNRGVLFSPVRVMWARLREAKPSIVFSSDGNHMTRTVHSGIGAMMMTLLTGRCPIGDEPEDVDTSAWDGWLARKIGYEVATQHATLKARVPGFRVLPSDASATFLSDSETETMSVQFRYPPTANVTVTLSSDKPAGAVVFSGSTLNSNTLTFTPANYLTKQTVSVRMADGSRVSGDVKIRFVTQSTDNVFNNLSDEWTYKTVPSYTWDGGGANTNWGTAGNWDFDAAVVSGLAGPFTFAGSTQLTNNNNVSGLIASRLTFSEGSGAFVIGGTGITLDGNIVNSSGNLQTINLNMNLSSAPNISGGDVTLGGVLSGPFGITKDNSTEILTLSGANSFTGSVLIINGQLVANTIANAGVASSLGASTGAESVIRFSASKLIYNGDTDASTDRQSQIGNADADQSGGATISNIGAGTLRFTNSNFNLPVASNPNRNLTLTGSNTGNNEIQGIISNNSTAETTVSLIKDGVGTWRLSGANAYTGLTTIKGGRLVLSGSLASNITVSAGTLAPEATPETTGSLTVANGGRLEVRLNGSTVGIGYDQLTVESSVSLAGNLDLVPGPGLVPGTSFTIINKTSAAAITGAFAGKPESGIFSSGGYTWVISYNGGDGNDVVVTIPTEQQEWRVIHFGTMANTGNAADTYDLDGDGESNLMEFATAQNPHSSSKAVMTSGVSGSVFQFTYTRSVAAVADGVVFTVEGSETLLAGSWTTSGISTPTVLSNNGTTQQVRVTVPIDNAVKRFVRLKIRRP